MESAHGGRKAHDIAGRIVQSRGGRQTEAAGGPRRAALHTQLQGDAHLPLPAPPRRGPFWYNPILYTAFFGLVGGLAAWGAGECVIRYMESSAALKDLRELDKVADEEEELFQKLDRGQMNLAQVRQAQDKLYREHADNRFLRVVTDGRLSDKEKGMLIKQMLEKEEPRLMILEITYLSLLGIFLACFISIADPVIGEPAPPSSTAPSESCWAWSAAPWSACSSASCTTFSAAGDMAATVWSPSRFSPDPSSGASSAFSWRSPRASSSATGSGWPSAWSAASSAAWSAACSSTRSPRRRRAACPPASPPWPPSAG